MAQIAPEVSALSALLPPLKFAMKGDNVSRLAGFEALVDGAIQKARGSVSDAVLDEVRAVAKGFDAGDVDDKKARAARLLSILERGGASNGRDAVDEGRAPSNAVATSTSKVPLRSSTGARPPEAATSAAKADALSVSLQFLKGIGPKRAAELAARSILTVGDALFTLPRTYEDRRVMRRIADLEDGALATVSGTVIAAGAVGVGGRGRRRYEVALDDGSAQLRLVFFHFRPLEMQKRFPRGAVVTASGEVQLYDGRRQMVHPRASSGQKLDELGGVQPVYPEIQGLHPLAVASTCKAALERARQMGVADPLPPSIRAAGKVEPLLDALVHIHAPRDDVGGEELRALIERRSPGHRRLAFEELFVLATALALRRRAGHVDPAAPLALHGPPGGRDPASNGVATTQHAPLDDVCAAMHVAPTRAQSRAAAEIARDLSQAVPMARLLQGDVGAGKTAVAAAACLQAVRAGFQAAFMAPTELLAEQHGRTLKRLFAPLGVRVEVITGSMTKKARAIAEARLRNRDLDVAVGTQALLSEGVDFAKLALCVVDEQHRFGVVQRAQLRTKGPIVDGRQLTPHLLVMTATPIPRSLALTIYGDLAVSVLDELPPGRTPVATDAVRDVSRAFDAVGESLSRNERAFVVYPLIDESEQSPAAPRSLRMLDIAAATAGFEQLHARFGDTVALLHGRMKAKDREAVMAKFARGDVSVLVSTTVIEVGVDVPEATLMVIMNAERFGLAQLHQLRGRVGRSARQSRCVLVVAGGSEDAMRRVKVLVESNDGFRIAEEDLQIRGAGDVLGTRQSGVPSLAFADLVHNAPMIEQTRTLADDLVARDPQLSSAENAGLRRLVLERYAARLALTAAG